MKKYLFLLLSMTLLCAACCQPDKDKMIREAVERQMEVHPLSTLQDLYKSFFQDRFGPGHIIRDTSSARAYLDEELASSDEFVGDPYEPTGYMGNFYRVNLSVIRDGSIGCQKFFDIFIRSANSFTPISMDGWKEEWSLIVSVIEKMDLQLDNYAQDKKRIEELLSQGQYAVHHSHRFSEAYAPHYRIITKDLFEKEMLPAIKKSNK